MGTETLYLSDRDFSFNGHRYESYLLDIPSTVQSIERFGGYLNINAQLTFRNIRFRSYAHLFDFFLANPIRKKEMDLYVVYLKNGSYPDSDVSTLIHKLSFGEFKGKQRESFKVELFSILYAVDQRKLFTQINRSNWPRAAPVDVGKFENRWIGTIRDVPCHCVDTGAVSTLAADTAANAATIFLTEVDYPLPFPSSGTIQLGIGTVTYTGKNSVSKSLTGCVWSIPARNQKRGEPVWEIRPTYKYLVDTGQIKSVSNVKAAGVKIADADRTINLNDGGKTTITFTQRSLLKNQGAHQHGGSLIEKFYPTNATFSADPYMGASGLPAYLKDRDESTFCHVGVTGSTDSAKNAYFTAGFPAFTGAVPDRIYACIVCDYGLGNMANEYFSISLPQVIPIGMPGYSQGKFTLRTLLSGTSVPANLQCLAHTNQGSPVYPCYLTANVYEMWLELEYDNVASSGENAVWSALVPQVTCDVEGYKDTAGGIYTGVANALIENPSDVLRYLLVGIVGRSMSEIDASFATVRTIMSGRVPGGYKIAGLLSKLGSNPMEICKAIQEQSRSQLREDGGKFYLSFDLNPTFNKGVNDILPSNGIGMTASGYLVGYEPSKSCDNNGGTRWAGGPANQYVQVDWEAVYGVGSKRILWKLTITPNFDIEGRVKDFILYGSQDGINLTPILSGQHGNNASLETFTFLDRTAYRFHRLHVVSGWDPSHAISIVEWELFNVTETTTPPTSVMDINSDIFIGDPVFNFTPAKDIKNLIRAVYNLDYSTNGSSKKSGDYLDQIEVKDSESIGEDGELPEDIMLSGVNNTDMAEDIVGWHLRGKKDSPPMADMVCNRRVKKLERGDHFTFYDTGVTEWEGTLWKVMEIERVPNRQQFRIEAIKYIVS